MKLFFAKIGSLRFLKGRCQFFRRKVANIGENKGHNIDPQINMLLLGQQT
jgi:hypothetical protein